MKVRGNVTNVFIQSLVGNLKVLGFKGTSASRLGGNVDLVVIISRGVNIVQDQVILQSEGVLEGLGAFPSSVDKRITLVEINLGQCIGLRGSITVDLEVKVVIASESTAFLRIVDRQTETTILVCLRIDAVIVERFSIFNVASSVGVRASGHLECARGLDTVRAMLVVDHVGDPDTNNIKKISIIDLVVCVYVCVRPYR